MAWTPISGATKWNTADWSDGACRGVRMSVRGATKWDTADGSDGACRGVCMSVSVATKWNTADPLDGACRGACKFVSGATKWNTADQSDGPCRGAHPSVRGAKCREWRASGNGTARSHIAHIHGGPFNPPSLSPRSWVAPPSDYCVASLYLPSPPSSLYWRGTQGEQYSIVLWGSSWEGWENNIK
jgi:hypothetical protein